MWHGKLREPIGHLSFAQLRGGGREGRIGSLQVMTRDSMNRIYPSSYREEYQLVSNDLRRQLQERARQWNEMKDVEVDLYVARLPRIPFYFFTTQHLDELDVYGRHG